MKFKFIQWAVFSAVLTLGACAGDSSKKNTDTASKQTPAPTTTRCPPGYLADNQGRCVEQQAERRAPLRDTLGRDMGGLPEMSLPSTGGLLGR